MHPVKKELAALQSKAGAIHCMRYFKCGKGEYGEGDLFYGVPVGPVIKIAEKYKDIPLTEVEELLIDPYHEVRTVAIRILVAKMKTDDPKVIQNFYMAHTAGINNWDLVDVSAHYILQDRKDLLSKLSKSKNMWEQRMSVVGTWLLIRNGDLDLTYQHCEKFLSHPHDLMHKACGWMLREAGKRDEKRLKGFLEKHKKKMPRVMLRYAIEKFPPDVRKYFLESSK